MKKLNLKNPLMQLSAFVSTYLMTISAHAQYGAGPATFQDMSNTASSNIYSATSLISTGSYTCGAAFGMAGLLSLKKHAETPANEPISKGIGRIGVGAGLCALPFVLDTALSSMGADSQTTLNINGSTNRF